MSFASIPKSNTCKTIKSHLFSLFTRMTINQYNNSYFSVSGSSSDGVHFPLAGLLCRLSNCWVTSSAHRQFTKSWMCSAARQCGHWGRVSESQRWMHCLQHSFEHLGHILASRKFSIQMKQRKISWILWKIKISTTLMYILFISSYFSLSRHENFCVIKLISQLFFRPNIGRKLILSIIDKPPPPSHTYT